MVMKNKIVTNHNIMVIPQETKNTMTNQLHENLAFRNKQKNKWQN